MKIIHVYMPVPETDATLSISMLFQQKAKAYVPFCMAAKFHIMAAPWWLFPV